MGRSDLAALVVVSLLVGAGAAAPATAGGPPSSVGGHPAAETVPEVVVVQSFAALPDRPGVVRARRSFEIPGNVGSLRTELPDGATVTETSPGFQQVDENRYEWTGGSRSPSITYRLPVNETGAGRGPEAADGRFVFADVGEWGLFRRPPAPVDIRYRGTDVAFARRTTVDGPGAAGTALVFVGDHEAFRRTAGGQTIRLVVPAAASLGPARAEVFGSLSGAAERLRVGDRDGEVFVVAAPAAVDWARRGVQTGEADLYVVADEPLDRPDSAWLHEYVHTRQDFNLTAETRWLPEATATYYAALLALEQDRVGFDAFADYLARGSASGYADAVLADPGTWTYGTDYLKGGLVAGDLDRRLRAATDGGADLQRVFRGLNEAPGPVDAAGFVALVRSAGTESVAGAAERYTTTTARPGIWTRAEHDAAFGPQPARIRYALANATAGGAYRVRGPYRNRSVAGPPFVLVPGETLAVDVRIENGGGAAGTYDISYGLATEQLGALSGSLGAGESRLETATVAFDAVGDYAVRVGEYTVPVTVAALARPSVSGLRADADAVAPGEAVEVSVDVENGADRPGVANLTVTADGSAVATERVALDAGASRTVAVTTAFDAPGPHRIAAGNRSVTVTVTGGDEPGRTTATTRGAAGPGPGPLVAALAVALALAGRAAAGRD